MTSLTVLIIFAIISITICHTILRTTDSTNWYVTTTLNRFPESIDIRGCYRDQCVYVASNALSPSDTILATYVSTQRLWAIGNSTLDSVSWVFSDERPIELFENEWISAVPNDPLKPSYFDPLPYMTEEPDPLVARFVAEISLDQIKSHVNTLAMDFYTRNSFTEDAIEAAEFLQSLVTSLGCQNSRLHKYLDRYSPNVICEIPGYDDSAPIVVVGAHYDSVSTFVDSRAPGADDNGSGSAGLLEIIRSVVDVTRSEGISLRRKIVFMLFSGEEQGVIGSDYIARELSSDDVLIQGMVNLDMIGYPERSLPTTLYWKDYLVNRNLTDLGISLTRVYLGEDTLIDTSYSCCSDFQSFTRAGYAAAGVFEATSGNNNPNYHRSTDLPDTVSYTHAHKNTQMATALIITLTEPILNGVVQ